MIFSSVSAGLGRIASTLKNIMQPKVEEEANPPQ